MRFRTLPAMIGMLFFLYASSSCFSPDYGVGGFACQKGKCPEGYTCVTSGTESVCRKIGARQDRGSDPVHDAAQGDAPEADGPYTDLLVNDRSIYDLLVDAPTADQLQGEGSADLVLPSDTLVGDSAGDLVTMDSSWDTSLAQDVAAPDQEQPDLSSPDQAQPDLPPDSFVVQDLPLPDLGPDGWVPDLMQADTVPPVNCTAPALAAQGVALAKRAMDMATTQGGAPHILYNTEFNILAHAYINNGGNWDQEKLQGGMIVERVSAAISLEANDERLHALYRKQDATNTPRVYHSYGSLSGSTVSWQAEIPVPTPMVVEDLDIGAHGEFIYIGASGQTLFTSGMQPIFNKWRLSRLASGFYNYVSLGNHQSDNFWDTRVGVDQTYMGFSFYFENTSFRGRMMVHTPHSSSGVIKVISALNTVASPAAVAVDATGNLHLVYAKIDTAGTLGTLHYVFWNGITDMNDPNYIYLEETIVGNKMVGAESVDIALSSAGRPHVTYVDGNGNLWWQVKTAAGWSSRVVWNRGSTFNGWESFHSARIDLFGSTAHFAFHAEPINGTPNIYYTECQIN